MAPPKPLAEAGPGDPVRRGPSAQALLSLEYWIARLRGRRHSKARRAYSKDKLQPSRDANRARVLLFHHPLKLRGRRECRVLAATHGPPANRKAGGSYHRFSQNIRHSLRDGFNAYIGLSPGTGLSCSHHARDHHLARLTPASGCQDHTTSRPPQRRSSARKRVRVAKASIASRLTFGDDWPQRPSCRGGTRHNTSDLQNT